MVSNGVSNGGAPVMVLYKVVNSDSDKGGSFNAFHMPRGNGPTLAAVKHHCAALRHLSHMGPDGFHWRVCVDEKPLPGSPSKSSSFSWWDIQDENAKLPVKEASVSEIARMFAPSKHSPASPSGGGTAKGAFKSLGKAISGAVDGHHGDDPGPRVSVIAFKLLDLVLMHEDFSRKHGGTSAGHAFPVAPRHSVPRAAPSQPRPAASPAPQRVPRPASRTPTPAARAHSQPHQQQQRQQAVRQSAPAGRPAPRPPQENLMDFGTPTAPAGRKLSHSNSMPSAFGDESRAEKLKREYAQNHQTQKKVWDEVDQRWVVVEDNGSGIKGGNTSAPPSSHSSSTSGSKVKGLSMEESLMNAGNKSADVQQAVQQRAQEMKDAQEKALQEIREREAKKKQEEEEEDAVRKRLEPKIKAWSEEHGKKKQLRALLASLHTILWPEANWKPVSIGDILDDSKLKRCYHKASRVVHPDKTHQLSPENRFLAKRIFDALTQAKTEFDSQ